LGFWKEGGREKPYTIILGRYGVATVKFIVGCFGVWPKQKKYYVNFFEGELLCLVCLKK
jgi:hypothetical protein